MSANIEQIKAMLERAGKTNLLQKQTIDLDKERLQLEATVNKEKIDKSLEEAAEEWSEEDEEMLEYVIDDVNDAKQLFATKEAIDLCDKEIAWLKSLRPQPKQEWSEEDEKNYNRIIRFLEPHKTFFPTKETKEEMQNWLKNRLKALRPSSMR